MTFRQIEGLSRAVIDCWQLGVDVELLTSIVPGTRVRFDRSAVFEAFTISGRPLDRDQTLQPFIDYVGEIIVDGGVAPKRWCVVGKWDGSGGVLWCYVRGLRRP